MHEEDGAVEWVRRLMWCGKCIRLFEQSQGEADLCPKCASQSVYEIERYYE